MDRAKLSFRIFVRRKQAAERSPLSGGFQHNSAQQVDETHSSKDPTLGLTLKSVVASTMEEVPLRMCIAAVSDASHGDEDAHVDEFGASEAFRSQGGKVLCDCFMMHHICILTVAIIVQGPFS